jgi:hypothetical protein
MPSRLRFPSALARSALITWLLLALPAFAEADDNQVGLSYAF